MDEMEAEEGDSSEDDDGMAKAAPAVRPPEIPSLDLPRDAGGNPTATHLRQFLATVVSARSTTELPLENKVLTWEYIGIVLPEAHVSRHPMTDTLHDLLLRMHLCLNLPEHLFRKPGYYMIKEQALAKKDARSKVKWAVILSMGSEAMSKEIVRNPDQRRPDWRLRW